MKNAESLHRRLILHSAFLVLPFSLPGRLISRTPPFEGGYAGANPAPAANFDKSSFDRSVVKQDHGWPTPSNRRGSTFPSDEPLPVGYGVADHLPRGVVRRASVSETEGPGAKPGEAANAFVSLSGHALADHPVAQPGDATRQLLAR